MHINIWDYWEIITHYTNPLHILTQTALYTFLFFIVMLLLVVFFRKRILVKRQHKVLQVLGYIYLFGLPLLTGFFGFKYGLANAVEKDLISHVGTYSTALENNFNTDSASYFAAFFSGDKEIAKSIPGINANQTIDVLTYLMYDSYGATLEKTATQDNSLLSKVAGLFLKVTKLQIISIMVKKSLHNVISEKLGLGEEVSDKLMKTKFNELMGKGIFKEIAIIQIENVFGGIKRGVILLLSVILGVIIIEIAIAHYQLKKKNAEVEVPVAENTTTSG